jgi:hypothetical protein
MKLIDNLLADLPGIDYPIKRACIGLYWTAVESRYVGMAHTARASCCEEVADAGNLIGTSAQTLAHRLKSWNGCESALGLAALNSLLDPLGNPGSVNPRIMDAAKGKTVTIVGRFSFNDEIRKIARTTHCLEIEPRAGELPSHAAEEIVPLSDVVVISASAIINKTLPRLLELSRGKECIVLGPSTPMNELLFGYGASVLEGIRVTDSSLLFNCVGQGVRAYKNLKGIVPVTHYKK